MESSAAYKFKKGYLPYTLIPILLIFAVMALSNSWSANLGGGIVALILSAHLIVFQLAIFHLSVEKIDDFHMYCLLITFANIFITPLVLVAVIGGLIG